MIEREDARPRQARLRLSPRSQASLPIPMPVPARSTVFRAVQRRALVLERMRAGRRREVQERCRRERAEAHARPRRDHGCGRRPGLRCDVHDRDGWELTLRWRELHWCWYRCRATSGVVRRWRTRISSPRLRAPSTLLRCSGRCSPLSLHAPLRLELRRRRRLVPILRRYGLRCRRALRMPVSMYVGLKRRRPAAGSCAVGAAR